MPLTGPSGGKSVMLNALLSPNQCRNLGPVKLGKKTQRLVNDKDQMQLSATPVDNSNIDFVTAHP